MTSLNSLRKAPSRDDVAEAIRQRILAADLVPGQRLVEAELCELLNATRGTVRNALVDLSHEGLVERIANRGARVRVVGLEEALQIAEVRMVLECLCVARAAERITDAGITAFRDVAERMKAAADARDIAGFAQLTHEASDMFIRIADQPVAAETLARLRARIVRHRFRLTYRPGRAQVALPFWLEIIDAICRHDAERAQRGICRHSENVQATMKTLAEENRPFATMYTRGADQG